MEKDLVILTCPDSMVKDEETFKNFKLAMKQMFEKFNRDVDLLFLPVGYDIKIIKGNQSPN